MPLMCRKLCCEYSFREFNNMFQSGVHPDIASAVTKDRLESCAPDQLYDMDMSEIGDAMKEHFEKDWLGVGGEAWFGSGAGELLYSTFVDAIKSAGSRQIKAVWVESSSVNTQIIEDERLVLILVGSPRPPGDNIHDGSCGVSAEVESPSA